ncbi:helix-turn-helix transcriptional regulator [Brevundimonas sp.]|uniref:helix-turn-helix transcriptional regulator n=1 Tax=Brevundimonas sp. TaxID=1871086 RepID=UPI00391D4BA8
MTAMVALAAWVAGLGVAGVAVALTGPVRAGRIALAAVFVVLTLLATPPLLAAFARPLVPLLTPWLLPVLLAAPAAFHAFVLARAADLPVAPPIRRRHLVLPTLGVLTALGYMALSDAQRRILFVEGDLPPGAAPAILALATFALVLAWPAVAGVYVVSIVRLMARYRARLKHRFSNIDRMEMRWVEGFMGVVALLWLCAAAALLTDNLSSTPAPAGEIMLVMTGVLLLLLIGFSLDGRTVAPMDAGPVGGPEPGTPGPRKYARSALTRDHAERLAERIGRAMREDELHLDPNLSLTRLSRRVGAAPNMVSQTLNDTLGRTFFDYVNDQRIDTAMGWLKETEMSVLDIAIAAGFNSRSTFYKAFRARTGQTPQDYRRGVASQAAE